MCVPRREAVRVVSASQPHAGDELNAAPMRRDFRGPTWAMRTVDAHHIVQRRLGFPLDEALASGDVQRRLGLPLDAGPSLWRARPRARRAAVAFRILWAIRRAISGAPATTTEPTPPLRQLVLIMQGVWGTLVGLGQSCARRAPKLRCLIAFGGGPNCSSWMEPTAAAAAAAARCRPTSSRAAAKRSSQRKP